VTYGPGKNFGYMWTSHTSMSKSMGGYIGADALDCIESIRMKRSIPAFHLTHYFIYLPRYTGGFIPITIQQTSWHRGSFLARK
jgi:hypothetical protein